MSRRGEIVVDGDPVVFGPMLGAVDARQEETLSNSTGGHISVVEADRTSIRPAGCLRPQAVIRICFPMMA